VLPLDYKHGADGGGYFVAGLTFFPFRKYFLHSRQLAGRAPDGHPIFGGGNISTTEEKGKTRGENKRGQEIYSVTIRL